MNKRGHVLNALLLSVGLGYLLEPAGNLATFDVIAAISVPIVLGASIPDVDTALGRHRKTMHNLAVLAIVSAYPIYFSNLQYVWIGVLSHLVLDLLGTRRGLALLYPLTDREFAVPIGVAVDSKLADGMMFVVTAFELVLATAIIYRVPQRATERGLEMAGFV